MPLAQTINVKNQFTANGYTYDAAGNVLADGSGITSCSGSAYTWNAEEQMSCAAGATYLYDGDGIRVGKSGGAASPTLYWGAGTLVESDTSGNVTSEYIFLGGKRIARRDVSTGSVYYYFADALGSSNVVATAAGAIENESDFYPFGGESPVTDGLTNQHYKFEGKERDANTASTSQPQGLDYFGARFDSSATGRFMSPDWANKPEPVPYAKLGNPQSLNLYAFALNNPESAPDLDGHEQAADLASILGAGAVAGAVSGDITPVNPLRFWMLIISLNQQKSLQPGYLKSDTQLAHEINNKENDAFNECVNKKVPGAIAAASSEFLNDAAGKVGDAITESGISGKTEIHNDDLAQQSSKVSASLGGEVVDAMKECAKEHPRAVLSYAYQGVTEPFGAGGFAGFLEDVMNAPGKLVDSLGK